MAVRKVGFLVAEPILKSRQIIDKILKDNGYRNVAFAKNPEETYGVLEEDAVDFALIDFDIASDKDFDLLYTLSDESRFRSVRVMVMGMDVGIGKVDEALSIGARDYINKPFTPYLLMVKVERIIFGPYATGDKAKPRPRVSEAAKDAQESFKRAYEDLQLRKYDAAVAGFAKAIKSRMLFPEAYKGIAEAFRGKGDLERYSQFLNKAAETYAWLDRHEEAESAYHTARKIDEKAPNPYKVKGDHLKDNSRITEVIETYEHAARLTPKDTDVAFALSRAYLQRGDSEKARQTLEPIVEKHGVPPEAQGLFMHIEGKKAAAGGRTGRSYIEMGEDYSGEEKRRAKRIPLAEYAARMPKSKEFFPVVDVSATGISFKREGEEFEPGATLSFDLLLLGESKARKITAEVVRRTEYLVACDFRGLNSKQQRQLNQIVAPRE